MAMSSTGAARIAVAGGLIAVAFGVYGLVARSPSPAISTSGAGGSEQGQAELFARLQAAEESKARAAALALVHRPDAEADAAQLEPPRRRAVDEREREVQRRESFVKVFEAALLDRQLKPESVSATGPDKTTLDIQGLVCPRDLLSGIGESELGAEARKLGFKRMECTFEQMIVHQDL